MRQRGLLFLTLALTGWLIHCTSVPMAAKPGPQWFSDMHRLSTAHLQLMPLVGNGRTFGDPARHQEIQADLKEFTAAAEAIAHNTQVPNADPLIAFSALRFAAEVRQANQSFQSGDLAWTRYSLSKASGYCISCHTRADRGESDFNTAWTPKVDNLSLPQRVEFYLANRRYASAMLSAQSLAADTQLTQTDPHGWMVGIERALALAVRVKKQPAETERLAQAVVDNRSAPYYIRSDAAAWLQDIQAWKKEGKDAGRAPFKQAVSLMKQAHPGGANAGRSGLIASLRASGYLHEELEKTTAPRYGEALLYTGLVEQSLGDLNQGYLDQYYFESCIRQTPHSELAEQCYEYLDRSIQASNPFLDMEPESEWARLAELRQLSEVSHQTVPAWKRRPWEYELNEVPIDDWRKKSTGR